MRCLGVLFQSPAGTAATFARIAGTRKGLLRVGARPAESGGLIAAAGDRRVQHTRPQRTGHHRCYSSAPYAASRARRSSLISRLQPPRSSVDHTPEYSMMVIVSRALSRSAPT